VGLTGIHLQFIFEVYTRTKDGKGERMTKPATVLVMAIAAVTVVAGLAAIASNRGSASRDAASQVEREESTKSVTNGSRSTASHEESLLKSETAAPAISSSNPEPTPLQKTAVLTVAPPAADIKTIKTHELSGTTTTKTVATPGDRAAGKEKGKNKAKGPRKPKPPIQDPTARIALSLVGADSDAEAYWYEAINDSNLSDSERSDLIEDLNEDGFTNPKHPTKDDLPLIESRMALLEEITPDAMDQTNLNAFAEAYKDLQNMYNRITGGG
jgi:hypothetical protein